MKRVLLVLNNLMPYTMTEVAVCLCDWMKYYATHKSISVDLYRANKWGFQRNFNEFVRYAVENEYEYFFQYDCDMTGSVSIIERLIAHDKEAVGCLYLARSGNHAAQLWNAKVIDGKEYYLQFDPGVVLEWVSRDAVVPTDVRASGYTLFKTEAIKDFGYPYAETKPNKLDPHLIDGFDMDFTRKISKKYKHVWTDCSASNDVKHWTDAPIKADSRTLQILKGGMNG